MKMLAERCLSLLILLFVADGAHAEDSPPIVPSPAAEIKPTENKPPVIVRAEIPRPEITQGPLITLAEALDMADKRNLDLASARLEVEKARAGLKKSWGMVLPAVQGKFDYTHMDHEDTVDLASSFAPLLGAMGIVLPPGTDMGDPLLVNPREKLVGALQVQVPLVNPEGWLTVRAAKKGVDVAALSIETVRRQILLGTSQSYYLAISCRDLMDFYHSQIVTSAEQLRIAEARFRLGRGMRIDVIRAQTDMEQAKQSLIAAVLAYDNARDTLGRLTGVTGLPLPADDPRLSVPGETAADLEKRAAASRADIKVDRARIDLMKKQQDAAWAKFAPSLGLGFQGSYQFTDLPDLGSEDKSRWALMLSLTVPIYNHFRYGDLDEKRAVLRQAEINLQNTEDKAGLAVRKGLRDYEAALASVSAAQTQVDLAAEGLKLTESAYAAGSGDSLSVTDARQRYIAAGFNLTGLTLKSKLALLSLLDAVGEDLPAGIVSDKK